MPVGLPIIGSGCLSAGPLWQCKLWFCHPWSAISWGRAVLVHVQYGSLQLRQGAYAKCTVVWGVLWRVAHDLRWLFWDTMRLPWFWCVLSQKVGRGSSVGITTQYGLDGPGIESRWGDIFRTRPDRPWGPPILLYNWYWVFPGGKAAGAWRWPPTPSSAEVKERLELYLYSPSGHSWPLVEWTLPLPLLSQKFRCENLKS